GLQTVATFFDDNSAAQASDFTATVLWGDLELSGPDEVSVVALGGGQFAVQASHTYRSSGTYALEVRVSDVGLASTFVVGTAVVRQAWWLDEAQSGVVASDPGRAQQVS